MNTTVLAAFPREVARVLRLVSATLSSSSSSSSSQPAAVLVACKLGKDRTGLVSALCLAVAGASRVEVQRDYARSATELRGRPPPPSAPSLGGAPRAAMERTLDWLAEHFGRFADEEEVGRYREREEARMKVMRKRGKGGGKGEAAGEKGEKGEKEKASLFCASRRPPCWRAGVLGYLEREAGFSGDEREALRRALTE